MPTARAPSYKGTVATFRFVENPATANRNLFSLFNAAGSSVLVAIRDLRVYWEFAGASGTVRTAIVSRLATAPTGGTTLTKVPFDTALSSSANVVALGACASDDGAETDIVATATTTGARVLAQRDTSAIGEMVFLHEPDQFTAYRLGTLADTVQEPIVLRAGEGVLVTIIESGSTSLYSLVVCMFEEFLYRRPAPVRSILQAVQRAAVI